MKKWMFLLVSLFTMQVAMADNDKPSEFIYDASGNGGQ